ncbi:MAG: uncharacterized protein H6R26_8 [Proteobacteria bacterium]|nr:uncharacterized protein [Pseudomonadota bacterium]
MGFMSATDAHPAALCPDRREMLILAVEHLDHLLPGQAPILNFVHHNTLHGFQHLPFTEALEQVERLTGIRAYLADEDFRRFYRAGRIDDRDLEATLDETDAAALGQVLVRIGERAITRRDLWRIGLLFGAHAVSATQLQWQVDHLDATTRFHDDVPETPRSLLLGTAAGNESESIGDLWQACLTRFAIHALNLHPEELAEETPEPRDGARLCTESPADAGSDPAVLFQEVGTGLTLRGLLLALTGRDLLDQVRPLLIRICASHLDEGLAAWHSPDRGRGIYASWRRHAGGDLGVALAELPDSRKLFAELPEESVDAVIAALERLGLPEDRWPGYLERLALEIPGWSGIINWRQHHPQYPANQDSPATLMDYLAIRLFLDSLWVERLCRETWGIAGRFDELATFAARNGAELSARLALYSGKLPEHLAAAAQVLVNQPWNERGRRESWGALAGRIRAWRQGSQAQNPDRHTAHGSAWRLFRLAQHLGLCAADIHGLSRSDAEGLLAALDELTDSLRGYLWLCSYERHYRDDLFTALAQNQGRGRWARRDTRPQAQIVFCMDDREESIRRHLEELNPAIETLGVAGFFGVAMNWRGLDDTHVTPLCPVVVTPSHQVSEQPRPEQEGRRITHDSRRRFFGRLAGLFNQELRRNLVSSGLLVDVLAPAVMPALVSKVFFPRQQAAAASSAYAAITPAVPTRLDLTAPPHSPPATPDRPRHGFTDDEQADRVTALLRNIGLTSGFAPLVVLAGHGSISQNNPHLAAYDCGACSGRHGGPNARAFAAMANRPEVRRKVAERGIDIPGDTWFLGTEHNTCNEEILWFDLEDLPDAFAPALRKLRADLDRAVLLSAHERCRRFASAPREPSLQQAMRHVVGRSTDFSQARPELGHATNAAAVIGRRSVTQGAFLDRRVFLISYDPSIDPGGSILEGILLAAGPVGAGINLEYYFSTVDNQRFGCGTKVPHNVTGLFGVMEGASSDLRTGLPRQMIEIHEAMRLQVIVEATESVLIEIYRRQPALRELIGNGWLLLSAIHPDTGALSVFDPLRGFQPWCDSRPPLPVVDQSADWYRGHSEPRPPALIKVPASPEVRHAG